MTPVLGTSSRGRHGRGENKAITSVDEDVDGAPGTSHMLVGRENDAVTVKDSLAGPQKVKHRSSHCGSVG